MNVYRIIADGSHVVAILILLFKLFKTRSSVGVSGGTQLLYAITYTARYLDVLSNFISVYNTSMKIFYIAASYFILLAIYVLFRSKEEKHQDTFPIIFLIIPAIVYTCVFHHDTTAEELIWTFSIYLEAVALVPQILMMWKSGSIDWYMTNYIICMAAYRGMYIANWVYRYHHEGYYDMITVVSGIVETIVGVFGAISAIYFVIRQHGIKSACQKRTAPSIYLLPAVYEELGREFLIHDEKSEKKQNYIP